MESSELKIGIELAQKLAKIQRWRANGPNRLVKVLSPASAEYARKQKVISGYVTQEKYLYGKNSSEIESALGLRKFELRDICYIYSFAKMPRKSDVHFKWFASFPDGKMFDDDEYAKYKQAEKDFEEGYNFYERSHHPVMQAYVPGDNSIPQWKVVTEVPIGMLVQMVTKTIVFNEYS